MKTGQDPIETLKRIGQENKVFFFKKFQVKDDQSTMKVGTDAILLGISVESKNQERILEVGAGCGVISLILAQRTHAIIDAVEIDDESVIQAKENVIKSPWPNRINIIHSSLQDFAKARTPGYDLVVSNPPFFSRSYRSQHPRKNLSRHDDRLSFEELLEASKTLLNSKGMLWVVLPVRESLLFRQKANGVGFYLNYCKWIIPGEGKQANRLIMGFGFIKDRVVVESTLVLRDAARNFSEQYKAFARDFFIDF